jgi:hypothetical protein
VRFDPTTSSWKTHRCLWEEDLPWSSVTLPAWGMTRSGVVFQQQTAARPISATASGFWPTPTASLGSKGGRVTPRKSRHGKSLIEAVAARTWPTPVASMAKGSSPRSLTRRSGASRTRDRLDHAVMASEGGQLNPTWVEWLMGWPIGWTDLQPLEMDKYREWRRQHSICCEEKDNKEAA